MNFLAALHGYNSSMAAAQTLLEKQLTQTAQLLSRLTHDDQKLFLEGVAGDLLFQVWREGGLAYASDASLQSLLVPLQPGFHRVSYRGFSWKALVYEGRANVWVIVAQRIDIYAVLTENIILESILPIIWVLPLLGVLIWVIVSVGLGPLNRLAGLLSQRKADNFTPLAADGYPEELGVLVRSTNDLLAGLSHAFEREKRFAADAAHELRTPLAVLKVNLHNLSSHHEIDEHSLGELVASTDRMGHSIEQLLALYRVAPNSGEHEIERTDISALAREVIAECFERCQKKQQVISMEGDAIEIDCDPFAISTLLRNLIDNASKYTPAGGRIMVSLSRVTSFDDGVARLSLVIEDSGPGIPEASRRRVFDRFYRLGGDQHASQTVGSGLGLSIVDHIVRLHHGEIRLSRSVNLGGLCVTVFFPLESTTDKKSQ